MLRKFYIPISLIGAIIMIVPIVFMLSQVSGIEVAKWQWLLSKKVPKLFFNSLSLVGTVVLGSLILGSGLAWLTERTNIPFKKFLRPLLIAPLIIPCYIITICYMSFFGMKGLCEKVLRIFINDPSVPNIYGFWGCAAMLIIGTYPYVYTLVRSSIRRLNPLLSEAAGLLGANRIRRLFKVMLPVLAPSLTAGAMLSGLYVLSDFGVVSLLRYRTFVNAIYEQMSGRFEYNTAAALSVCLIVMTIFFLFIQETFGHQRHYSTSTPRMGQLNQTSLGFWKWPAFVLCIGVSFIGFLLPLGILTFWFIQSLIKAPEIAIWQTSFSETLLSAWHSLSVSVIAAIVSVVLALPLAYWVVRKKSKFAQTITWISQSGIALPGVLIALGISLLALNTVKSLNFSVAAIILAFVIHFYAKCFQSIRSGYMQISSKLEESARLLGASPLKSFWMVTRPLLTSSILGGWLLVFLSSIRELPAALLLRPAGFDTLTVKVWVAASEGFYEYAALPALMLVVLSLPIVWIIVKEKV